MKVVNVKIEDLKFADYNPRWANEEDVKQLKKSIKDFGFVEPIVVNNAEGRENVILGGHFRVRVAKELGIKEVPVHYLKISDIKREQELNLRLNKNLGRWSWDLLANFDEDLLLNVGFEEDELLKNFSLLEQQEKAEGQLKKDFIIPPFSVFNTQFGYWQERRQLWLNLGIESQLGRGDNLLNFSETAQIKKKNYAQSYNQKSLNKIMDSSFKTGTSIFDPVLCEVVYKWFCPETGIILDPFSGGSVRGIVANFLGYQYAGIDLSREQVEANGRQSEGIFKNKNHPNWIIGNALEIDKLCKDIKADFIFSCPPYFDLERYSDNPEDLSNLHWEDFLKQYNEIIDKSLSLLKEDRFACFVVSDIRNRKRGGCYRNFVGETIKAFTKSEDVYLYNEIILINAVGSLPIRVRRQFNSYRKVGKMHQNVLVFYKGDIKKIKENFKKIKIELPEQI